MKYLLRVLNLTCKHARKKKYIKNTFELHTHYHYMCVNLIW